MYWWSAYHVPGTMIQVLCFTSEQDAYELGCPRAFNFENRNCRCFLFVLELPLNTWWNDLHLNKYFINLLDSRAVNREPGEQDSAGKQAVFSWLSDYVVGFWFFLYLCDGKVGLFCLQRSLPLVNVTKKCLWNLKKIAGRYATISYLWSEE